MMKRTKGRSIFALMLAICLLLAACSSGSTGTSAPSSSAPAGSSAPAEQSSAPTASGDVLTLKLAHVLAPEHPYNLAANKFKEILEANAPTPVVVEVFPSGQLGSERDITEGMQFGTVDIGIVPGTITLFEPKMGAISLPYIFDNAEHAYRVLDGEIGQELAANLPGNGLRLLSYWENGFRSVTNNQRPITQPDDLKGLKIRVPEDVVYQDAFNQFGANVTAMAFGELYTALQQKTIDGQENPLALIATNKIYEVQEYLSLTEHFYGPAQVLISEERWQSLSPEMQAAVQDAMNQARDFERQTLAENNASYLQTIIDSGTKVNEVDKSLFMEDAQVVWDKYRGEYGDVIDKIRALA